MNKYEMIEEIVRSVDGWTEAELRDFVRETLVEQWSAAPLAAIRREFNLVRKKNERS